MGKGNYVHVTRKSNQGVYGHTTAHCDAAGCNGSELFWSAIPQEAVHSGDVVFVRDEDGADSEPQDETLVFGD
jgi:hypothetical protein